MLTAEEYKQAEFELTLVAAQFLNQHFREASPCGIRHDVDLGVGRNARLLFRERNRAIEAAERVDQTILARL